MTYTPFKWDDAKPVTILRDEIGQTSGNDANLTSKNATHFKIHYTI